MKPPYPVAILFSMILTGFLGGLAIASVKYLPLPFALSACSLLLLVFFLGLVGIWELARHSSKKP